jgi:hypothetical protein
VTSEAENTDLAELSEEAWHARPVLPRLPKRDGDQDGGEEVGDGVVKVGVLGQPASALQQRQESRPGAQEEEGREHQRGGAAPVHHGDGHLGRRRRRRTDAERSLTCAEDAVRA